MIDREGLARVMDDADGGYSIKLIRLVDGEQTYADVVQEEVERADLFGLVPKPKSARKIRIEMEAPFIRNQYGLWCPQCGEQIADWEWVGDCDACGYPSEIESECDDY